MSYPLCYPGDRSQLALDPRDQVARGGRDRIVPLLALAVLVFSTVDGLATLWLTAAGVEEANPLMRQLLAWGPGPFLFVKLMMTAAGLPFLIRIREHPLFGTRLRSGHVLLTLVGVYATLIAYEVLIWSWLTT